jgi:hypothetical protein
LLAQLLPHGVEGVMELLERCMSWTDASATWPSGSSVAGFTFQNVWPPLASTSAPSISILGSGCTCGLSVVTP